MSARLISDAAFLAALASAQTVSFSSYVLNPGSRVAGALTAACDAGAKVDVLLQGAADGSGRGIVRANAAAAAELERHGAHVTEAGAREPIVHLKAAVVDGVAYLDDCNWSANDRDTIAAFDDPADVAAVAAALHGVAGANGQLATDKDRALALERETILEAPGDRIDVETESFAATAVSSALAARAAQGDHVRLLVTRAELAGASGDRERHALAKLAAAGVRIETTAATEKLCIAGATAWVGSANATFSPGPMLDWGWRSRDPAIVSALAASFERNWDGGRALSPV